MDNNIMKKLIVGQIQVQFHKKEEMKKKENLV